VGANAAHDHLALRRMAGLPEPRDVANEGTGFLLPELDPADVGRMLRKACEVDIDPRELRVRERRRDIVEWSKLEQDADGDHEVVSRLRGSLQVRLAVVGRVRDEDAPGDAELLLGALEADIRQVVEALV